MNKVMRFIYKNLILLLVLVIVIYFSYNYVNEGFQNKSITLGAACVIPGGAPGVYRCNSGSTTVSGICYKACSVNSFSSEPTMCKSRATNKSFKKETEPPVCMPK